MSKVNHGVRELERKRNLANGFVPIRELEKKDKRIAELELQVSVLTVEQEWQLQNVDTMCALREENKLLRQKLVKHQKFLDFIVSKSKEELTWATIDLYTIGAQQAIKEIVDHWDKIKPAKQEKRYGIYHKNHGGSHD